MSDDLVDIRGNSLLAYGSRKDIGGWQLHINSAVCFADSLKYFFSEKRNNYDLIFKDAIFLFVS